MRLLIDGNLAPRIASLLNDAGHDAVHVRDSGAARAPDTQIIDLALADGRTIVSADTDFGALLASTGATGPSVILVREVVGHRPTDLVGLLVVCIDQLEGQLAAGAMVALTTPGARVRRLPCCRPTRRQIGLYDGFEFTLTPVARTSRSSSSTGGVPCDVLEERPRHQPNRTLDLTRRGKRLRERCDPANDPTR